MMGNTIVKILSSRQNEISETSKTANNITLTALISVFIAVMLTLTALISVFITVMLTLTALISIFSAVLLTLN